MDENLDFCRERGYRGFLNGEGAYNHNEISLIEFFFNQLQYTRIEFFWCIEVD